MMVFINIYMYNIRLRIYLMLKNSNFLKNKIKRYINEIECI